MTRFITNYYIHNYLLSYSLFAHANITFELNTLQIYAKYLYVSIRMGCKHTIRLCKRLHERHEDMFFRQEDIKQIEEKAISSGCLRPP